MPGTFANNPQEYPVVPDTGLFQNLERPFQPTQPASLVSACGSARVIIGTLSVAYFLQPATLHYGSWPSLATGPSTTPSLESITGYECNIYSPVNFSIELDDQHI